MNTLSSAFATLLGVAFVIAMIVCIWANNVWHRNRSDIVHVGRPLGMAQSRIESEIKKLVSDVKLTADEIVEKLRHLNGDDVWATLLEMLKKGRLIETQDSNSGYYLYHFTPAT
jgi:hypothetical protein